MSSPDSKELSPEDVEVEAGRPTEQEIDEKASHYFKMILMGPSERGLARSYLVDIKAVIERAEDDAELVKIYKGWIIKDYEKLVDRIVELFREKIEV